MEKLHPQGYSDFNLQTGGADGKLRFALDPTAALTLMWGFASYIWFNRLIIAQIQPLRLGCPCVIDQRVDPAKNSICQKQTERVFLWVSMTHPRLII